MFSVKMLRDVLTCDRTAADRWYVSDGSTSVGPVSFELLERGIEAGKVPLGSFVRHEAWKVWRPLLELGTDVPDSGAPTLRRPGPPVFDKEVRSSSTGCVISTDDITWPGRPSFPEEMLPDDAFAGAADLNDALILLLCAAVQRARADTALLYEVRVEGAVVIGAHGPLMREFIGRRMDLADPVLALAATGASLIAEPSPGPAGRQLLARLSELGVAGEGGFMMPIRPHGRLCAALEIGRRTPFRVGEIAEVEALVDALHERARTDTWT